MVEWQEDPEPTAGPNPFRRVMVAASVSLVIIALLVGLDYYLKNKDRWAREIEVANFARCVAKLDAKCLARHTDPEALAAYGMTDEQWNNLLREFYEPDPSLRPTFDPISMSPGISVQVMKKGGGQVRLDFHRDREPFDCWNDVHAVFIHSLLYESGLPYVPDPMLTRNGDATIYGIDRNRAKLEAAGVTGYYMRTRERAIVLSWDLYRDRLILITRRTTGNPNWEPKPLTPPTAN